MCVSLSERVWPTLELVNSYQANIDIESSHKILQFGALTLENASVKIARDQRAVNL